jgi:hypothetical protein
MRIAGERLHAGARAERATAFALRIDTHTHTARERLPRCGPVGDTARMRRPLAIATLLLFGATVCSGCKPRLNGSITINGTAFTATDCRSGQVSGFTGVDLVDASGNKLRLVATPSGQPMVYYVTAGSAVGTPIGMCGAMTINRTNTRINSVYNVEGQVTLACMSPQAQVSGSMQFANCH